MDTGARDVSLVIPVRDEEANIAPMLAELNSLPRDFLAEVILVDDGSRDGTWAAIRAAASADARVRGVRLSARSGKAAAYREGFQRARGAWIATMDGDLQDDPRDLLALAQAVATGADMAVGIKQGGKSSASGFVASRLGNAVLRCFLRPRLADMNCPVRVMRTEVAHALDLGGDLHRFIPALAHAAGFTRIVELPVSNRARQHGQTKYGGSKYITGLASMLGMVLATRFGKRPMAFFGLIGIPLLMLGLMIDGWFTLRFLFAGISVDDDLPTVILGVLCILMGTQFLSLGFLGELMTRRLDVVESESGRRVMEQC
jgi:glycosyltransferase involved in cell wall biosynthesis